MQGQPSDGIQFVRVIDPRVNINSLNNREYAILDGPSENNHVQDISSSFSNNTINITLNPPNRQTYISRYLMVEVRFEINFTGVSGGAGVPLLQAPYLRHAPGVLKGNAPYDAPRGHPLMNATNSLQIKMGDATISQNINQFFRNFNHYHNFNQNRFGWESPTPSQLDPSWSYANTFGTVQNPMNGAYDYPDGSECGRGGFIDAVVTQNTATGVADTAQVLLTVREPVLISPFLSNGEDAISSVSFIGIDSMSMTWSLGGRGVGVLGGLTGALWSHNPLSPSVFTASSVNVLGAQTLSQFMTPDPTQMISSANSYSYSEPNLYPTTVQNVLAPGASTTVVMNNIQLSSVPNLVYVSVQEADQLFNFSKTDTFFAIENVNITFDNRSSLLATMTQLDLYNMSRKNGSIQSWRQFSYDQGSVIAISFGTDLALGASLAPSTIGNFSFSMKVTFRNQTDTACPIYTLNVIPVLEGTMLIDSNRCYRTLGAISRADVLASKSGVIVPYRHPTNFYGGGWLDKLKSAFGSIAPWLRKAVDVGQMVAPQYAGPLGLADQALRLTGNGLVGGRRRKHRGGEMVNKGQLIELLDE